MISLDVEAAAGSQKHPEAMEKKLLLSVVIPARNERESLQRVLEEIPKEFVHEIIVVDGHSTDGTPELVRQLGYRVVPQEGIGYGMGVITGIKVAGGDVIAIMNADGSMDPGALPYLLRCIQDGYDVAFCSRYRPGAGSEDDSFVRLVGNKIFTFLLRLLFGVRLTDVLFTYLMGKKKVFESLNLASSDFALCAEIPIKVQRLGYRYTEVPSRERKRIAGKSKVNAFVDGLKILRGIIRLRLAGAGKGKAARHDDQAAP